MSSSNRFDEFHVQYPHCAWRHTYSQLRRETSAWDVAFPDQNSVYHAMLVYFNPGDEFVVEGESLPYVRYFSLQTYDRNAASLGSLIDYKVLTDESMGQANAYNNATAGQERSPQGSFEVRVTAHGNKYASDPSVNELAALSPDQASGFFFLFLRYYVPERFPADMDDFEDKIKPMTDQCYGRVKSRADILAESKRWGWVCPPTLTRVNSMTGKSNSLPYCVKAIRQDSIKSYDQGKTPKKSCLLKANTQDNFFLPANSNLGGEFRNR